MAQISEPAPDEEAPSPKPTYVPPDLLWEEDYEAVAQGLTCAHQDPDVQPQCQIPNVNA